MIFFNKKIKLLQIIITDCCRIVIRISVFFSDSMLIGSISLGNRILIDNRRVRKIRKKSKRQM